jgi:hypothetical protein
MDKVIPVVKKAFADIRVQLDQFPIFHDLEASDKKNYRQRKQYLVSRRDFTNFEQI